MGQHALNIPAMVDGWVASLRQKADMLAVDRHGNKTNLAEDDTQDAVSQLFGYKTVDGEVNPEDIEGSVDLEKFETSDLQKILEYTLILTKLYELQHGILTQQNAEDAGKNFTQKFNDTANMITFYNAIMTRLWLVLAKKNIDVNRLLDELEARYFFESIKNGIENIRGYGLTAIRVDEVLPELKVLIEHDHSQPFEVSQFTQLNDKVIYTLSRCNLTQTAQQSSDKSNKAAGLHLATTIDEAVKNGSVKNADLPRVTKYLNDAANLIKTPDENSLKIHQRNTRQAIGINRKWSRVIGGAMLCVLGAALIASAIIVAVLTFGVSSPLSIPALTTGGAVMVAGVALSTTAFTAAAGTGLAVAALGGAGILVKSSLFANDARKGDIAVAMGKIKPGIKSK